MSMERLKYMAQKALTQKALTSKCIPFCSFFFFFWIFLFACLEGGSLQLIIFFSLLFIHWFCFVASSICDSLILKLFSSSYLESEQSLNSSQKLIWRLICQWCVKVPDYKRLFKIPALDIIIELFILSCNDIQFLFWT